MRDENWDRIIFALAVATAVLITLTVLLGCASADQLYSSTYIMTDGTAVTASMFNTRWLSIDNRLDAMEDYSTDHQHSGGADGNPDLLPDTVTVAEGNLFGVSNVELDLGGDYANDAALKSTDLIWEALLGGAANTHTVDAIDATYNNWIKFRNSNATKELDVYIEGDLYLGEGLAGKDLFIRVDGETNDGTVTFMEDEDRWDFGESISVTGTVTGTTISGANVTTGADPGHTHTGTSLSGIDHGSDLDATSLTHDDHTQYTLADGTRAFTGHQSLGDYNITNVGSISLDSISADGTTITVNLTDNTANAFMFTEALNAYLYLNTTDGLEKVYIAKQLNATAGAIVTGTMAATTVTGANVTSGADPGHTHTGASVGTIDISDGTNLAVGDGMDLTDDTLSADINTTNLKFTATEIDTIQSIATGASPTFADLTLSAPSNIYALSHDSFADFAAGEHFTVASIDHGSIGGLGDADHDAVYFQESEFLNTSAGAGDAGKPVKLDAAGHIDATMINDGDVAHSSTGGYDANQHVDHTAVSVIAGTLLTGGGTIAADRTLNVDEASINHDALTNFAAGEHFTVGSIDHGSIAGLGDADHNAVYFQESEFLNTSAGAGDAGKPIKLDAAGDIDATMINSADVDHDATANFVAGEHLLVGAIDHDSLLNFAANEHFTEASIDHGSIAGLTDDDHVRYFDKDGSKAMTGAMSGLNWSTDANGFLTAARVTVSGSGYVASGGGYYYGSNSAGVNLSTQAAINFRFDTNDSAADSVNFLYGSAATNVASVDSSGNFQADGALNIDGAGDSTFVGAIDLGGHLMLYASSAQVSAAYGTNDNLVLNAKGNGKVILNNGITGATGLQIAYGDLDVDGTGASTFAGSVSIAGEATGTPMTLFFGRNAVSSGAGTYLFVGDGANVNGSAGAGYVAPANGSIIGIGCTMYVTDDDCQDTWVTVRKNGADMYKLTLTTPLTQPSYVEGYQTQARGADTFLAGDNLGVIFDPQGSTGINITEIVCWIMIVLDDLY